MIVGSFEQMLSRSTDLYIPKRAEFYANLLYQYVDSCFSLESIEVLSFDVFDTLLLRNEKYELHRFLEISELVHAALEARDINSLSIWDIYAARLVSFRTCYRTVDPVHTVREGKLIDVLTLMAKLLDIDSSIVPELVRIELMYERENLQVNPLLKVFLNHPVIRTKAIIFISDMYLSTQQIGELVQPFYADLQFFRSYSSASIGSTKSSGLLYEYAVKDLKISRSCILHMGDNFYADVEHAKKRGLKAIHLPVPDIELEKRDLEKQLFLTEITKKGFDLSLVH